jgi:hypothetical protein
VNELKRRGREVKAELEKVKAELEEERERNSTLLMQISKNTLVDSGIRPYMLAEEEVHSSFQKASNDFLQLLGNASAPYYPEVLESVKNISASLLILSSIQQELIARNQTLVVPATGSIDDVVNALQRVRLNVAYGQEDGEAQGKYLTKAEDYESVCQEGYGKDPLSMCIDAAKQVEPLVIEVISRDCKSNVNDQITIGENSNQKFPSLPARDGPFAELWKKPEEEEEEDASPEKVELAKKKKARKKAEKEQTELAKENELEMPKKKQEMARKNKQEKKEKEDDQNKKKEAEKAQPLSQPIPRKTLNPAAPATPPASSCEQHKKDGAPSVTQISPITRGSLKRTAANPTAPAKKTKKNK